MATGELAQMVERLLSMQEVLGSIPRFSILSSFGKAVHTLQCEINSILVMQLYRFEIIILCSRIFSRYLNCCNHRSRI